MKHFYSSQAPNGARFSLRRCVGVAIIYGDDLQESSYSTTVYNGTLLINSPRLTAFESNPALGTAPSQLALSLQDATLYPDFDEHGNVVSFGITIMSSFYDKQKGYRIYGDNFETTRVWYEAIAKEVDTMAELEALVVSN